MRRVGLCFLFTNTFNVWLNKVQLESYIWFCILSDVMSYSLYGNEKDFLKIVLWFILTISNLLLLELAVHGFQVYLNRCVCSVHKTTRSCSSSLRAPHNLPFVLYPMPQAPPDLLGACCNALDQSSVSGTEYSGKAERLYQWALVLMLLTCVHRQWPLF